MGSFPPALVLLAGAVVAVALPGRIRPWVTVVAGGVAIVHLFWLLDADATLETEWLGMTLTPLRVDKLSLVFGYAFAITAFIGGVYALHMRSRGEQVASLLYGGSALGVVFAGDLLTVVLFLELMAVFSAYVILVGGRERSRRAAVRYAFVHLAGGSTLLAGVIWHVADTGSLAFNAFDGGPAAWLVLLGFAVNAAIPPLHAWLSDAYPEASVTGAVFLSAFTTKTAVYVLARGFGGWDVLLFAGVIMALYGVVYAVLENDVRRLLSYHIISQVGYMVAAVGIGTEMAINGAAAHAFAHVLYKGLLFMGAGAAIHATGRRRLTDLGGIAHLMPVVVVLYMIGAFSISAFPLFSGFTTKSLVIYAAEQSHITWAVFLLYGASVGTFLHTGLKLPYFTWFGPKRELPLQKVPPGMYAAMGMAVALCIGIGVYPGVLYDLLPFPVAYQPYTADHVITSLALLGFTAVGFWLVLGQLKGEAAITLDTDWFYRKARRPLEALLLTPLVKAFELGGQAANGVVVAAERVIALPDGLATWGRRIPTGVAIVAVLLTAALTVLWSLAR
ncbi:MAG: Na(+)/H(+) antiporter subunit D [Chloroflexi bacterium]|nr:Na(+)/H(+) antiporter subunit D [Chloroflexota bacterium]